MCVCVYVCDGTDEDDYYSLPYHAAMPGSAFYGDYYHDLETSAINHSVNGLPTSAPNSLHLCCVSDHTINGPCSYTMQFLCTTTTTAITNLQALFYCCPSDYRRVPEVLWHQYL